MKRKKRRESGGGRRQGKEAGDVAQLVECLSSKHEILGSIPQYLLTGCCGAHL